MLKFKTNNVNEKLQASVKEIETLIKEKIVLNEQLASVRELSDLINKEGDLTDFLPILNVPIPGLSQLPRLIDGLNELQKKKKLLALKATSSSIIFKDLNSQLEIQRTQVQKLIDRVRKGLYKKIIDIQSRINELEAAFGGLPAQEAEYKRIERLYKIYEGYYLQMLNRKAEIGISEAGIVPEFVILSQANLPKIPISPRRLLIYAIAGGFGAFLSFALVVIRYLLHNKVTNLRELERVTRAPILGTVPKYKHRKLKYTKLLVHINPKSSLNEALRSIRTNLAFILPQGQNLYDAKDTKIISITSTISGEGKTFVATNLGGIIAMSDKKVILLDCDMRKPKLHIAFDVENDVGVSNVLIKQNTIEECIKKTPIDTLDFISAGPTPPNPSELILRSDFDDLLVKLKENYDIIIIDTPPVGLVTDGVLIMKKVDVPLYVVKAHYSRKVFGKGIDKLVQSNNFHNLSIVLNSVKHMTGYGGYKYGYGYGYGKYYGGGYYEDKANQQSLLLRLLSIFKRKK
jgi:capsular exopolysaccharide synthesis family protein